MPSLKELNDIVTNMQQTIEKQQEKINSLERQVTESRKDALDSENSLNTKIQKVQEVFAQEGDRYLSTQNYEEAVASYEKAIKLGSTMAPEKLAQLKKQLLNFIELVQIPAGKFVMGGVREIHFEGFLMGKYPVTQAQWKAVMGSNPSHFKGDNRPVEGVSWHDAQLFCQKLSFITGRTYQLPSESQWQYASSACTTSAYFFGEDPKDLDKYAWYGSNSDAQTHAVGEKLPNPWGLYDVLGNVWEWCQDDWQEGLNHIPTDGKPWVNNRMIKCVRGGSRGTGDPEYLGSDCRHKDDGTSCNHNNGLRVVAIPGNI